jgi:hypothetical protein
MYRQRDKVGFTEKRGIPINSVVYKTCISDADMGGILLNVYILHHAHQGFYYIDALNALLCCYLRVSRAHTNNKHQH